MLLLQVPWMRSTVTAADEKFGAWSNYFTSTVSASEPYSWVIICTHTDEGSEKCIG